MDYSQLPNTFYRVSVKALIFNQRHELLVFCDDKGEWELPGGGWDYPEDLEACVRRELHEEVRARAADIGDICFTYFCESTKGYHKLCLALPVSLEQGPLHPTGDDLVEARYVTREEFLTLPFQITEAGAQACVDLIWQ